MKEGRKGVNGMKGIERNYFYLKQLLKAIRIVINSQWNE